MVIYSHDLFVRFAIIIVLIKQVLFFSPSNIAIHCKAGN